jgi:formylglycine-generating enzyme required for sulfatase activity
MPRVARAMVVWVAGACLVARGAEPATEVLENSIGIKLVRIPAGEFEMGHDDDGMATRHAKPAHRVRITKPFYLGMHEVTNAHWKQVTNAEPAGTWKDADRPVAQMDWGQAAGFCTRLSALPAERKAGRVYRLPTEAEWEYACRAGTTTHYAFGDDWQQLPDYGWFVDNSRGQTQPVGTRKANPWGLHDMHGNVWEWCSDWYGPYGKDAVTDPQGAAAGTERVIRGGSFQHSGGYCRSAARVAEAYGWPPYRPQDSWGFRVAMTEPDPPPPDDAAK